MPQIRGLTQEWRRNARTHRGTVSSSSRSAATILHRGQAICAVAKYFAASQGRFAVGCEWWLPSFQLMNSRTYGYRLRKPRKARRYCATVGTTSWRVASRETLKDSSTSTCAACAAATHWSTAARLEGVRSASHPTT